MGWGGTWHIPLYPYPSKNTSFLPCAADCCASHPCIAYPHVIAAGCCCCLPSLLHFLFRHLPDGPSKCASLSLKEHALPWCHVGRIVRVCFFFFFTKCVPSITWCHAHDNLAPNPNP
ncbi:unnamed protein product, partial [Discosporangium mesarthrocarpum]